MARIRLLVLDVLKPHQPSIIELAKELSDLPHIDGVDITVYEIDSKVENVKITIITFDHASQLYAPKNKDEAVRIINGIRVGGSTSFSSAISCIEQNIDFKSDELSNIEDMDLAKGATDLNQAELKHQVALDSTARLIQPTLINFLK